MAKLGDWTSQCSGEAIVLPVSETDILNNEVKSPLHTIKCWSNAC